MGLQRVQVGVDGVSWDLVVSGVQRCRGKASEWLGLGFRGLRV